MNIHKMNKEFRDSVTITFELLDLPEDTELSGLIDKFTNVKDSLAHETEPDNLSNEDKKQMHTYILAHRSLIALSHYFVDCEHMPTPEYVEGLKFILRAAINELNQ